MRKTASSGFVSAYEGFTRIPRQAESPFFALHLELVSDYTSESFLAAFDRFVSRRGLPLCVYSDNGTNFKGAENKLKSQLRQVTSDINFKNIFASDEITWKFIPPGAPHFGGLWEAGVKSVKFHLKRIIGEFKLTYEKFNTLLCKVESCLNSRPIHPLSDDPESFDTLTPGHFLTGSLLKAVPTPSLLNLSENRLSRWQTVQAITERFWKVWSSDYLNSLQTCSKWPKHRSNLKINDLVLIKNPNFPPTKWELERVVKVYPRTDNLVRMVDVKTVNAIYTRPISKLCLLPVAENNTFSVESLQ
ncbi:uncharacterized protein LOC114929792 [Nylanderia fulva]|uniref:uncharacterized protein LOC114929792 n=1 Tax=Nylanderia fulva TaxID=613905 RepID=UPI0010FB8977|nr:uncharacterized protein LOC114929792 [Nylanderia fulva]